jgi:hypothetical protein
MSHINFIIVIKKLNLKRQSVVEASTFFLQGILEIANVGPISVPANTLTILLISCLFRVKQWFHTLVIRTFRLNQIYKVEFVSLSSSGISYSKVVPLCVSSCIMIVLQNQIVFIITNFNSSSQITRFETTLKNQSCIFLIFFLIVCFELFIVSVNFECLLVESRALARRTVRIVLSVVDWVVLWRQFDHVILVKIRS